MSALRARFSLTLGDFHLDATLEAPDSGVTALFGPSGSGKSTFLRCLMGLIRAPGGECRLGARIWQEADDRTFIPLHRRRLGVVFQTPRLFPHLDVAGNLAYAWRRTPPERRRLDIDAVVGMLKLEDLLHRDPRFLSGGEQQRVAIGRAIVTNPDLLVMDEPLSSLDHRSRHEILQDLERVFRELRTPVIYVSHDFDEILRFADRLALIERGSIRAIGPVGEMVTRLDLPLAHAADAGTVVEARVDRWDEAFALAELALGGGPRLTIPNRGWPIGAPVRVRILARDVSLTLEAPHRTSILNVIPATVRELFPENPAQVMVKLDVAGWPLLARITLKSRQNLGIHVGQSLWAQVKSVAVERE
ncbi:MAG: molybdenum ABC transporter ATP-binding protein [Magnetococcales bacterium]|nr:molybdenum ABC transporter ATP-binding protein [Magnetococcales bacterium]